MSLGLAITAITAHFVSNSPFVLEILFGNRIVFYIVLIVEVVVVVSLVGAVKKLSSAQVGIVFLLYSLLNGITFSVIFLIYDIRSIGQVFIITAVTFGAFALYGYSTKRDLSTVGGLAMFGLFGLIIASVVNLFLQSSKTDFILSCIAVAIFVVLTAYDMQKIKAINIIGNANTDTHKKESIMGALVLYLDFINLFLSLLRILGKRK